jgi:hypothetical protein
MMVKIALESFEETRWAAVILGAGTHLEDANTTE